VCGLPKLIAACHVLLRLSLPRHPPCALSSLTIELTPAQGAESLRSCSKSIYSPPLSVNRLAHANRFTSPKDTLHNMNTSRPQLTCSYISLCSALYVNASENLHRPMRLTADKWDFQMRYPINFVVKYRNLLALSQKASPEAVETRRICPISRSAYPACFQIEARLSQTPILRQIH
jgi:hypothetical protein